jgi:Fe-Mn family superoxide dismutase
MNRREFLKSAATGAAFLATVKPVQLFSLEKGASSPYVLPPLPYGESALAPYISAKTISFHYGKHHKGYADKYNDMIKGTPMADQTLEKVIQGAAESKSPLFNISAQIWNHTFYWNSMHPNGGGAPIGKIKEKIQDSFGDEKKFREEFAKQSVGLFGSGWVWLVEEGGKLKIVPTKDADTPIVHGQKPLLTLDVWEHAYYLDYQNKRKDYVEAYLDHLVNWSFAEKNLS